MSIIFQYKNITLEELSKNTHFDLEELESILSQCYELEGIKIFEIYCVFEQTSHSHNAFECEVILKIEGPDIRVRRDGKEPYQTALKTCNKILEVARRKSHKES
jgi:hypothetical protein